MISTPKKQTIERLSFYQGASLYRTNNDALAADMRSKVLRHTREYRWDISNIRLYLLTYDYDLDSIEESLTPK